MIALLVMLAVPPPPPPPTRVQVAPLTCSGTDKFSALSVLGVLTCSADTSGGAAPATAQYWVGAADATLSAEKNLGALSTGLVINTGGVPTAYAGAACGANQYATQTSSSGALTCAQVAYSQVTGTPTIPADLAAEPFITKTATANLSNEFALGSLATGLLINTATTGVPTIKGTNTCTNQFPRSDNASGTWTCASVADADLASSYSGVGTCTNQFARALNDNAAPTCATVVLGTDTSGSYYNTVMEDGAAVTQRSTLNFIGTGVTCIDNASRTECTFTGGGGGLSYAEVAAAIMGGF